MGNNQSQIDELKRNAKEMEETFERWTEEQEEALAKEEEEREKITDELNQMKIDRKKKEDEQAKLKQDALKKEKENALRIMRETERQEQLRAEEGEKKRMQNIAELRTEIKQMKPGGSFEFPPTGVAFRDRLNIGLFGATGIGKTSLMNSLKFAVNGELKESQREQASSATFQGGHTTRRMAVRITEFLTFVDNRGVGAEDLVKDGAAEELIRQIEGRGSYAFEVDWGTSSPPEDMDVDETKEIYCTVLVFNAMSVAALHTIVGKFVERLLKWQGRFPLAVITHVDDATSAQLDNMRLALMMAGIVDVYEVANITDKKKDLEPVYQESLLKLLHKCIKDGDRIFELRHEIKLEEKKRATRKNKLAN